VFLYSSRVIKLQSNTWQTSWT